jgi:hypothetical protein
VYLVYADPYGIMANYLSRGAALVPKPYNTVGVDCMIPLVLQDGRFSFVYIQTKFGCSFTNMPPSSEVAASSPHAVFSELIKTAVPYAYIFHHICL